MIKRLLVVPAALIAVALSAFATLGGSEQSVISDQIKLQASRKVVPEHGYRVHEITREDGTLINEYVSFDGKVFGVSWKGPTLPIPVRGTFVVATTSSFLTTLRELRDSSSTSLATSASERRPLAPMRLT